MVDYGYGHAVPDSELLSDERRCPGGEVFQLSPKRVETEEVDRLSCSEKGRPGLQRRSSMKRMGAPRRSSIGYTGEISVRLPGHHEPVKRRTSITFQQDDEVKEVEPVHELMDQPEQLWFQQDEYDDIRDHAIFLVGLASSGEDKILAERNLCTRGLEPHINQEHVEEECYQAWESVFSEQCYQRDIGEYDEDMLAEIYHVATLPSRLRALQLAQQDLAEADKSTKSGSALTRCAALF